MLLTNTTLGAVRVKRLDRLRNPWLIAAKVMVGVAQLVERRVVVADVAGSSPVTHPNF